MSKPSVTIDAIFWKSPDWVHPVVMSRECRLLNISETFADIIACMGAPGTTCLPIRVTIEVAGEPQEVPAGAAAAISTTC